MLDAASPPASMATPRDTIEVVPQQAGLLAEACLRREALLPEGLRITEAPPPGAFARVIEMQAAWYALNYGFPLCFEAMLAGDIADYARALPHPDCRTWVALDGPRVVGCITIDGRGRPSARLRWFFVEAHVRGGVGRQLLDRALGFCEARGFADVWLTTFADLAAARRLYLGAGFGLEHEAFDSTWGVRVREQVYRLRL